MPRIKSSTKVSGAAAIGRSKRQDRGGSATSDLRRWATVGAGGNAGRASPLFLLRLCRRRWLRGAIGELLGLLAGRVVGLAGPLPGPIERGPGLLLGGLEGIAGGFGGPLAQLLGLFHGAVVKRPRWFGALVGLQRAQYVLGRLRQGHDRAPVLVRDLERRQAHTDPLLGRAEEAAGAHHHAFDLVLVVEDEVLDVADDLALLVAHLGPEQEV